MQYKTLAIGLCVLTMGCGDPKYTKDELKGMRYGEYLSSEQQLEIAQGVVSEQGYELFSGLSYGDQREIMQDAFESWPLEEQLLFLKDPAKEHLDELVAHVKGSFEELKQSRFTSEELRPGIERIKKYFGVQ